MTQKTFGESPFSHALFANTKFSWFWLIVRLYVGWEWFSAALEKVTSSAWVGSSAGTAISGFVQGALSKTGGANPDVQSWYASFLSSVVLAHPVIWSYVISYGELLVGIALIVGVFTGIAAFFGLFMNLNYLLAGTVSINPILFTLAIGLILAWRVAGYWGLDYWILPWCGTPWQPGNLFEKKNVKE
jgi:thiosulfate dehydrogenase [quinone] large subunit